MEDINAIILLARNELKLALKDRSTILWLFIMPAVFFYFIGAVTQGGMSFVDTTVNLVVVKAGTGSARSSMSSRPGSSKLLRL